MIELREALDDARKAHTNAVLEVAAKKAEDLVISDHFNTGPCDDSYNEGVRDCAASLRALKTA